MPEKIHLNTVYGESIIFEPVLCELINSTMMQRLKKIHQYGITYYIEKPHRYSRYDHSIGVFILLRNYGASLHEQIAGLLHDVSHTAFSHISDFLFDYKDKKNSYQDSIHKWFIQHTELIKILKKFDIKIEDILHKNEKFSALELDLPALCADRIEYTLYGGYLEQLFTHSDINYLLSHLSIHYGKYIFTQKEAAQKFAYASLKLTKNHFTAHWNLITHMWAAQMLKYALKAKIITFDDIHFSYDDHLWEILRNSHDHVIQNYMNKLIHHHRFYTSKNADNYTVHLKGKFRGIDPHVKINNTIQPLSAIDNIFHQEFLATKKIVATGHYIKIHSFSKRIMQTGI